MEKEFVPYDLALELKELGFDEECFAWYNMSQDSLCFFGNDCCADIYAGEKSRPEAPLWQQAFRFFREKYRLQSEILWRGDMGCFCYKIGNFKYGSHDFSKNDYKTYEEAELECLKKLIEIAKEQNVK